MKMNNNSKLLHLVFYLILAIMLASCAIKARPYVPILNNDVAYLRIVSAAGYELPLTNYVFTYKEPEACKGRYYLQGFEWVDKSSLTYVKINSNKTFVLSVQPIWVGYPISHNCHVGLSFIPEKNKYYTAILKAKSTDDYCYLGLKSSSEADGELIDVFTERKEIVTSFMDENSSFCKASESSQLP